MGEKGIESTYERANERTNERTSDRVSERASEQKKCESKKTNKKTKDERTSLGRECAIERMRERTNDGEKVLNERVLFIYVCVHAREKPIYERDKKNLKNLAR